MQLNDSEASFDLLNDKISLFDSFKSGMESNSHDFTEGTFDLDFEAAKLGAFAAALAEQDKASRGVPVSLEDEDFAPPPDADVFSPVKRQVTPLTEEIEGDFVPVGQLVQLVSPAGRQPSPSVPQSPTTSEPIRTPVATPKNVFIAEPAPPPIAGLRIVKRSKLALEKAAEAITGVPPARLKRASTTLSTTSTLSRRPSVLSSTAEPAAHSRTSSRSISPPDEPAAAPARRVAGSSSRPVPVPVVRRALGTDGPRRVLVDDTTQEISSSSVSRMAQPSTRVNSGRVVSSSQSTGPRRVLTGASSVVPSTSGLLKVTHSRQVSSSLSTGLSYTSGLPKPVSRSAIPQPAARGSRLPAPSASLARSTASKEAGRGGLLRKVI